MIGSVVRTHICCGCELVVAFNANAVSSGVFDRGTIGVDDVAVGAVALGAVTVSSATVYCCLVLAL